MRWCVLILVFAATVFAQAPVRVEGQEARSHALSELSIRAPIEVPDDVWFEIRVNQVGQVVGATPIRGRRENFEAAEKAVRSSQYKPFLREGQPVEVILITGVLVIPAEIQPKIHVAFPEVQDWNTVRFKLTRTVCFGSCPAYEVEIQGTGVVTYTGRREVAVTGTHTGSITRGSIESLMTLSREADFFSMNPRYASNTTAVPTYTVSLSIDGQERAVEDYDGAAAGMPLVMGTLERAIDEYSGSGKWVRWNVETVPALRAEGFDFGSQEAGSALAYVAGRGDANAVRGLILAGAPLDVPTSGMFLVEKPLRAAARNPDSQVMRLLIDAGASKDDQRTKNEAAGVARDRQDVLEMLVKYGARLGQTPR